MNRVALAILSSLCLVAGLAEALGQSAGTTAVQLNTATFTNLGTAPQLVQALGGSIVVIVADNQPSPTAVGNSLTTSMAPQTFAQADNSSVIWARGLTGQAQAVVTPILYGSVPIGAATQIDQTNVQSAPGTSASTALTVQGSATGVPQPVTLSSVPLPTGAATSANQPALNGDGGAASHVTNFPSAPPVYLSAGIYSAATIGTSDSTILSASAASHFLDLRNQSSTATICINFGATATISGTTCASGEIYLPPGWRQSWGANDAIPQEAIHAIASAASTPASVGAK